MDSYQGSARTPEDRFTASIRNLYSGLGHSTDPVPPLVLLSELRNLAPQFAEMDSAGRGFAQQGTLTMTPSTSVLIVQMLTKPGHKSSQR